MKKLLCLLMVGATAFGSARALAADDQEAATPGDEPKKSAPTTGPAKSEFTADADKISYAIGVDVASNIRNALKANNIQLNIPVFLRAVGDVLYGKPLAMSDDQIKQAFESLRSTKQKEMKETADKNLAESKKFLEENAKKKGVTVLPSGLQYKVIKEGTGPSPKATDRVKFNYRGTLMATGQEFDNSYKRDQPLEIGVDQVVAGMTEALKLMKVGAKWELYIPPNLGYKEMGQPPVIPPNAGLIFDVELLEIVKDTDNTTAPK